MIMKNSSKWKTHDQQVIKCRKYHLQNRNFFQYSPEKEFDRSCDYGLTYKTDYNQNENQDKQPQTRYMDVYYFLKPYLQISVNKPEDGV